MRSARPKVLHEIAGRSMLAHVLAAVAGAGATRVAVVVGPDRDDVAAEARAALPGVEIFVQRERLGTAHAVLSARAAPASAARTTWSSPSPIRRSSRAETFAACGRRWPRARPSSCSASRRAIRPATAASCGTAVGSPPSASTGTPREAERAITLLQCRPDGASRRRSRSRSSSGSATATPRASSTSPTPSRSRPRWARRVGRGDGARGRGAGHQRPRPARRGRGGPSRSGCGGRRWRTARR